MRDTAEQAPAGAEADPPPAPPPEHHNPAPAEDIERTPQPAEDAPRPAQVVAGPSAAMAAEVATAVPAALFHAGGWIGLAAGAAAVVGTGAAGVAGRRRVGTSGRAWTRTRTWSTGGRSSAAKMRMPGTGSTRASGSRTPQSFGRSPAKGGATGGRAAGMRAGGVAGRARAGRLGSAARRATASPAVSGPARAARRATAATGRAARSGSRSTRRGMDHATTAAIRNARAARAAHRAVAGGGTGRDAARAARASLKDSHAHPTRIRWRRLAGAGLWSAAAWTYGRSYTASRTLARRAMARLRGQDPADTDAERDQPRIETKVNRPTDPAANTSRGEDMTRRESGGGVPSFVATAQEHAESLARYEPPPGAGGMVQMYHDIEMLPDALAWIAQGFERMATRCRKELPLHPAISELVVELAKTQTRMASVAAEIKPAITKLHEEDLKRHEAPRPSEERWNV
ncbi:hypothetical protein [Actinomadura litoris]|uniref:Uncharacterized protein n=1 Tax=Actinomadura litoris TaxID=2678616 RepID=A0A7K1LAH7_9ACTN|nr:hypothetical protein [Actinomadura litoris]MUN41441.1 hypothetical protein [Actinomadura litoris]